MSDKEKDNKINNTKIQPKNEEQKNSKKEKTDLQNNINWMEDVWGDDGYNSHDSLDEVLEIERKEKEEMHKELGNWDEEMDKIILHHEISAAEKNLQEKKKREEELKKKKKEEEDKKNWNYKKEEMKN